MVIFDSATREQDYLASSERGERVSLKGEWTRWGVGCTRVWEVGLAEFEINDLNMFSGRESSQRKSADKSTGSATAAVGTGETKVFFPEKKERKRRRSWGAARPAPAEPRCRSKSRSAAMCKSVNSESTTHSNHLTHGTICWSGSAKQARQLVAMAARCV